MWFTTLTIDLINPLRALMLWALVELLNTACFATGTSMLNRDLCLVDIAIYNANLRVRAPPLAVPDDGSCAASGRAWRLWAAPLFRWDRPCRWAPRHCPLRQPPPKVADFTLLLAIQADARLRAGRRVLRR